MKRVVQAFGAAIVLAVALSSGGPVLAEDANRQTLVLATPKADDPYYADAYDRILRYQADYVALAAPHDDVVIFTDQAGYDILSETVPPENLVLAPLEDIWTRDVAPVEPNRPLQFRYAAAAQGGDQDDADFVQDVFNDTMADLGVRYRGSDLILDGGNYVSDGRVRGGHVIVTERFQEDNDVTRFEGRKLL
ncbi:MAG: agmatine deiminase family protein, partial [Pseudomonadota bacterium]